MINRYQLSIICPAIRTERWPAMYKSIEETFSGTWELILITERKLPKELINKKNIKVIFSERAPMQKQQQGLKHAEGEWITVISDDSLWLPGQLDLAFKEIKGLNYQTLIVLKYLEGKEFQFPQWYIEQVADDMKFKTNYDFMRSDKYYWSDTHESSNMPGIPYHSPILSCALISRQLLLEVGGWDATFQSQAMGNVDLSARLMRYGCKYIIFDEICSTCGYMEDATGDHGSIHYAQIEDDQPILNERYKYTVNPIFIELDNWKETPEIWKRKKGIPKTNPDLTVIVPGIRVKNWKKLYDSVKQAFSGSWEIIFISPYTLPKELVLLDNVRLIQSWRNPITCQQLGLLQSKGDYITWAADDGYYLPKSLDIAIESLKDKNYKAIVMGKYQEGDRLNDAMEKIDYYILSNHISMQLPFVPKNYYMLNCGVVSKKLLIELGGWDCENFEVCPLSYNDFAIRAQRYGCEFIIQDDIMFACGHMPGHTGDHGPIHEAQTLRDHPIFEEIYRNPSAINRIAVSLNGWINTAEKWERRFK